MLGPLPKPLNAFSLDLPEVKVGISLEMNLKVNESKNMRLTSLSIKKAVDVTHSWKVNKTEALRGAHYLNRSHRIGCFYSQPSSTSRSS